MRNYFHLYALYSHRLIAQFIRLLSELYELESADKISEKEAKERLKTILKSFEANASYLHQEMVTYHWMDSKLPKHLNEQEFTHLNMKFKYIMN